MTRGRPKVQHSLSTLPLPSVPSEIRREGFRVTALLYGISFQIENIYCSFKSHSSFLGLNVVYNAALCSNAARSSDREENMSADMWWRKSCKTSWQAAWLKILSFLLISSTSYMARHLYSEFEFNSTIIKPKLQNFLHSLYSHVGKLATYDVTSSFSEVFPSRSVCEPKKKGCF